MALKCVGLFPSQPQTQRKKFKALLCQQLVKRSTQVTVSAVIDSPRAQATELVWSFYQPSWFGRFTVNSGGL